MKWELRRLRERRQQHQRNNGRIGGIRHQRPGAGELRQLRGAAGLKHQNARSQQGQASTARDEQRLSGRATRLRTVMLEPDQKI